jgi:predicted TPR repeat methyltransferase
MLVNLLSHPKLFDIQQNLCNTYENIKNHFQTYVAKKNLMILDVGCSTGIGASRIFNFDENRYLGIDLSDRYLEFASKKNRFSL